MVLLWLFLEAIVLRKDKLREWAIKIFVILIVFFMVATAFVVLFY